MSDDTFKQKTVFIAGLGLMGASLAKALKKHGRDITVYAHDTNGEVERKALSEGVIDAAGTEYVKEADIIVAALYPKASIVFLEENLGSFKRDAIVTDLCGLKREICERAWELSINFCGSHPMKGREKSGYDASTSELFKDGSWIFTPFDGKIPPLLEEMARCAGASNIQITTPENHDRIIAYTSELPHILAPSYIENPIYGEHIGFCGGSFEDITRVATLNASMWSEIFCENSDNIVGILDNLIDSLGEYRRLIAEKDFDALCKKLTEADIKKRSVDKHEYS